MPEPTDREILQELRWTVGQIKTQVDSMSVALQRAGLRFQRIELKEQETSLGLSSLRSDFSRAMLTADMAQRKAEEVMTLARLLTDDLSDHVEVVKSNTKTLKELTSEFTTWKLYAKAVLAFFGLVQLVTLPLLIEALKRIFFP